MKLILFCILALIINGCAISDTKLMELSAGPTGCHPDNMTLLERKGGFTGMTYWVTECNGTKYMCSPASSFGATCKPMQ